MRATPVIAKVQPTPLERFLGGSVRITDSGNIPVGNYMQAEWLSVSFPEKSEPEEQGKLYLYPIAEDKYCLQLCYLQLTDVPGMQPVVVSLRFLPAFFEQYPAEVLMKDWPFSKGETTERQFALCAQSTQLLAHLRESGAGGDTFSKMLQHTEAAMHLLRRALACIATPFTACMVPACRFLAHESEREKVYAARMLIEQQTDKVYTIRELSRRVAMNECYLKKGFKALVGKTIHEYQQELRIARAKELLRQQGHSVTDVAHTLGYSSISHFSTAFKRVTGMKPCELLA